MHIKNVTMGQLVKIWQDGKAVNITLCVTEACNLACKYCYMTNKDYQRRMSLETGIKIIDYILTDEKLNQNDALVLDYIGGEPLLEIKLINDLSDYLVYKLYTMKHKWHDKYRFVITTNGLLYLNEEVQKYIKKYNAHLSLTISLDGTPEKHNQARIKRDGSGSYDDVVKAVPLWLKQFPIASTKATFSHNDLPYLKDSIIHLWNLGIKIVMANLVYEDVWEEGDDHVFEEQLRSLADYIVENDLWEKKSVRFFSPTIGLPLTKEHKNSNVCGAGKKTLAFDCDGNIFPCIRFVDFCTEHKATKRIGDISVGINEDMLKPFSAVTISTVVDDECDTCEVASSCDFCTAFNYVASKKNSVFERTKYICKMHKANARVNEYLWYQFSKKTGCTSLRTKNKVSDDESEIMKYLFFITADDYVPHCGYKTNKNSQVKMSFEVFQKGMDYCYRNHLIPIFLGKYNHGLDQNTNLHVDVYSPEDCDEKENHFRTIMVYEAGKIKSIKKANKSSLVFSKNTIGKLYQDVSRLLENSNHVSLYPQDLNDWDDNDFDCYKSELRKINKCLSRMNSEKKVVGLNVISDKTKYSYHNSCGAGKTSMALAPDGNLYWCPAFYFSPTAGTNSVGSIDEVACYSANYLLKNKRLPFCSKCNRNSCQFCLHENMIATGEMVVPSDKRCRFMEINDLVAETIEE